MNRFIPSYPNELAKALNLNPDHVDRIVKDYPELADLQNDQLHQKWSILMKSNIFHIDQEHHFRQLIAHNHPWLLLFRSTFLASRIKWYHNTRDVKYQTSEVVQVLPLVFALQFKRSKHYLSIYDENPMSSSLRFLDTWHERLTFLSHHLELTRLDILSIAKSLHSSLLTRDLSEIKEIMLLLKDSGLTATDLLNDLYIFRHNIDLMKERIQHLKNIDALHTLKTWMLRAPVKTMETSFKIRELESKIIGKDRIQFLSDRLNVSRDHVEAVVAKYPFILGVKAEKMESIINHLLDVGYSGWEILQRPRCFQYSLNVLKERHRELTRFWTKPPFNYLSLDVKNYMIVFHRALERKEGEPENDNVTQQKKSVQKK